MFWFVFTAIILFIIFLIVILISSTRTSTDRTLRNLKDELEAKRQEQPKDVKKSTPKAKPVPVTPAPVAEVTPEVVKTEEDVEVPEEEVVKEVEEIVAEPEVEEPTLEPFIEEELEETPEVEETEEIIEEEKVAAALEEPAPIEEELPIVEEENPFVEEELPIEEEVEDVVVTEVPEPLEVVVEAPVEIEEEEPYTYATFDNARTLEEFGLSEEEAADFIVDLIKQVEDEMPGLEAAVEANDAQKIEDISHMIKGSATNLGTGGIADVLIDFNTYMKTAHDEKVIAKHMKNLHRALKELKEQFQS